jgi:hypothetical protein
MALQNPVHNVVQATTFDIKDNIRASDAAVSAEAV